MTSTDVAPAGRDLGRPNGAEARRVRDECEAYLYREAALLDDRQFEDWLDGLAEDITYEVPVRITRGLEDRADDFSQNAYHMRDSLATLQMRVKRLRTEHAFGEDPPSRTTRLVTNVHLVEYRAREAQVRSNLMLYRAQGLSEQPELFVGTRLDTLRATDDGWKLARRTIRLAQTALPGSIGVFL